MQSCTVQDRGNSISKSMDLVGLQGWREAWREQMKFCGVKWACFAVYSTVQPSNGQTQHKHNGRSECLI